MVCNIEIRKALNNQINYLELAKQGARGMGKCLIINCISKYVTFLNNFFPHNRMKAISFYVFPQL
jgi:hypothetical protein